MNRRMTLLLALAACFLAAHGRAAAPPARGKVGGAFEVRVVKDVAFYDGKTNWLASPQGTMEMPPPVLRQMQGLWLQRACGCSRSSGGSTKGHVQAMHSG